MMAPTLLKFGLLLLSQLHLTWAMKLPPHALLSCTDTNPAEPDDTCTSFATRWDLDQETFERLNPDINCSKLVAGQKYCVIGNYFPTPTTGPTLIRREPATSSLASTQPTYTSNCVRFELARKGQECDDFDMPVDEFKALNSQIDANCTNLLQGFLYCIKGGDPNAPFVDTSAKTTLATATAMPPMTTLATVTKAAATSSDTKATTTSTAAGPLRTHPGYATNCKDHDHVQPDDSCYTIAMRNKPATPDDIMNLNKVGADCKELLLGFDVCVRVST